MTEEKAKTESERSGRDAKPGPPPGFGEKILHSVSDILVATDRDGIIIFFNEAAERFSGFSRDEALGTHICTLYADPDQCRNSLKTVLETGEPHLHEARIVAKNGRFRLMSVSRAPVKDDSGAIIGFVASTRDITEEKQALDRIRSLEDFREQILNSAHDVILATDRAGIITFLNPAALRMSGYRKEEILGRHICDFDPDPAGCRQSFEQVAELDHSVTFEANLIRKDGKKLLVSVSRAPLHDKDGTDTGFVSLSKDKTKEAEAAEQARKLQEFSQAILDSAHDLISVTDQDGLITFVNRAWSEATGYSPEEAVGRHVSSIYKDSQYSDWLLREVERSGKVYSYEAAILDKWGQERYLSVNKGPLRNKDGQVTGYVAVSRDLTNRREAIETLRHVQHFLEQILNSAHDIIVATDLDGTITYYNQAAVDVTGYTQAEAVGSNISDMYQDSMFSERQIDLVRKTGAVNSYEAVILDKRGREHIFWVNKAPLRDAEGAISGFVSVSRDITERKKAEEKVQELSRILSLDTSGRVEPFLLRRRVADLMNPNPVTCMTHERIGHTLKKLIDTDVPLLPVLDRQERVMGTISLKDLAAVRLFGEQDWRRKTAGDFINAKFTSIHKDALFFDALTIMVRNRADTLIVEEGGFLVGVVSYNDILKFQGLGVLNIVDHIERQDRIEGLAETRSYVNHFVEVLLNEGALPSQVCNIITEFNDKITRRTLEMVMEEMGPPPAPFAWMGLGSEGRKEQTLVTDQDNALIIGSADPPPESVLNYFGAFAGRVVDGLARCGFPLCPGGMMASNPRWSGSPNDWMRRVRKWVQDPTDENLLACATFADFRLLYGDETLFRDFQRSFMRLFEENPRSLTYMAEAALRQTPPLNLFKQFMVEKSGKRKGTLNIKNQGTLMIINLVRVFALMHGVTETNTWERVQALKDRGVFSEQEAESIMEAFNHMVGLRLKNMAAALREDREPDNFIDPDRLSPWSQKMLKQAYDIVSNLSKKGKEIFWWIR